MRPSQVALMGALVICCSSPFLARAETLPAEECTGENCLPKQDTPLEQCTGENCSLPTPDNPVEECTGQNCTPKPVN